MWVGTGSVWGPKLGVLPKTHQEQQHKERGLGHGQGDGGSVDPLQPRVKGRSCPGVVDFKLWKGTRVPPGWLWRAQWGQQAGEQLTLSWGTTNSWSKVLSASEYPCHPWRVRILPHTGLSHSGVTDLIFFLLFFFSSRAAMTCHVKAFY